MQKTSKLQVVHIPFLTTFNNSNKVEWNDWKTVTNICFHCSIHNALNMHISDSFLWKEKINSSQQESHDISEPILALGYQSSFVLFKKNSGFQTTKKVHIWIQMKHENSRSFVTLLTKWVNFWINESVKSMKMLPLKILHIRGKISKGTWSFKILRSKLNYKARKAKKIKEGVLDKIWEAFFKQGTHEGFWSQLSVKNSAASHRADRSSMTAGLKGKETVLISCHSSCEVAEPRG